MWQSGAEGGSYLARFAAPCSPWLMILPLQGWRSAVCRGRAAQNAAWTRPMRRYPQERRGGPGAVIPPLTQTREHDDETPSAPTCQRAAPSGGG